MATRSPSPLDDNPVGTRVVSGKATVELTVTAAAAGTRTVVGRARVDLTSVAK